MRNILITVMMLIVVALLYKSTIVDESTGIRTQIESKAAAARSEIMNLQGN